CSCGDLFSPRRVDALTCSSACRQRVYRGRRNRAAAQPPLVVLESARADGGTSRCSTIHCRGPCCATSPDLGELAQLRRGLGRLNVGLPRVAADSSQQVGLLVHGHAGVNLANLLGGDGFYTVREYTG